MSKVLTPARRARLEKLATYLEGLPADYRHFEMKRWITGAASEEVKVRYARKNGGVPSCGTAACAAGHGPAAGILVPPRFITEDDFGVDVDWALYAEEMFSGQNGNLYIWLFGGTWSEVDNHHWGAAARIRYALDKGGAPKEFSRAARSRWLPLYAPYRIDASADTRRMAETALAGSGRSPSGAVPATPGDAQ